VDLPDLQLHVHVGSSLRPRDVISAEHIEEVQAANGDRGVMLVVPNTPQWVFTSSRLANVSTFASETGQTAMVLTLRGGDNAIHLVCDLGDSRLVALMWRATVAGRLWLSTRRALDGNDISVLELPLGRGEGSMAQQLQMGLNTIYGTRYSS